MSQSNIYEIMQAMRNKTIVQNDFNEINQTLRQMLTDKYTGKIQKIVTERRENALQNPSKEVKLLHAFKPFVNENSHGNVDAMINCFTMMDMFKSINSDYTSRAQAASVPCDTPMPQVQAAAIQNDFSVHEDGVYDIDNACLVRKKKNEQQSMYGALLAMMMLGFK